MSVLHSNSTIFVIPVYIFNGRKQTLVDTIEILSALRMRGLHDQRHLLAKLRICGSENWVFSHMLGPFTPHKWAGDGLTESCDWTCNIDTKTWKTALSCCESVIFWISIISSVEINVESRNLTIYFFENRYISSLLSNYWLDFTQSFPTMV